MADEFDRVLEIQKRESQATKGPWIPKTWVGEGVPKVRFMPENSCGEIPPEDCYVAECNGSGTFADKDERNVEFIAAAREDIPWLCDRLLESWHLLQIMAQDSDAYRRGIAEGLRLAQELMEKEAAIYNIPGNNTMFAEGRKTGHKDMIHRVSFRAGVTGLRKPPLPPEALLRWYEEMRAAMEKVLYETRIMDMHSDNKVIHCERIAREALREGS